MNCLSLARTSAPPLSGRAWRWRIIGPPVPLIPGHTEVLREGYARTRRTAYRQAVAR